MAHDAFISYASEDKPTADATVAVLEQQGIRCWIAPRDILPGADWGETIVEAIAGSRVLVLVFSEHANRSPQIKREVERAVHHGLPVIPMRIQDVMPAKALEYFLSTPHWLDAFSQPLAVHLDFLGATVKRLLAGPATRRRTPPPKPVPPAPLVLPWWRRRDVMSAAAVLGLALLVWAGAALFDEDPAPGEARVASSVPDRSFVERTADRAVDGADRSAAPPAAAADPAMPPAGLAAFIGRWRLESARMDPEPVIPGIPALMIAMPHSLTAAFLGPRSTARLTVEETGSYALEIDVAGEGRYQENVVKQKYGSVAARGSLSLTPAGGAAADHLHAMLHAVDRDVPHLKQRQGDASLSLMPPGNGAAVTSFSRPVVEGRPAASILGTWKSDAPLFVDSYVPYQGTLELKEDLTYRIALYRTEKGLLEAEGGRFRFVRSVALGPPVAGTYRLAGSDRFTVVEPRGTATWVRDESE